MKIRATVICYFTPHDINGNSYAAFRWIDHETGVMRDGHLESKGNLWGYVIRFGLKHDEVCFLEIPMKKREFFKNKTFSKYRGDIAEYMKEEISAFKRQRFEQILLEDHLEWLNERP